MKRLDQLVQRIPPGSRLLRAWPLKGGLSAQVTAFEIEQPDGNFTKLVLRRHGDRDLERNPRIAADEFARLQVLQAAGVAAPKPCHLDPSCELFATPFLVVEYIEGQTAFAPADLAECLIQIASHLARITPSAAPEPIYGFCPEGKRAAVPCGCPRRPTSRCCCMAIGDPLADLGNGRLEILWAFGIDVMRRFTDLYQSITAVDLTGLPYWDLWAAVTAAGELGTWGLDAAAERAMREKLALFIERAREKLPAP